MSSTLRRYEQIINIDNVTADFSGATVDAFSRLRVSNPFTLFQFTSIMGKQPLLFDEISANGGSATAIDDSLINMSVTNTPDS